MLPNPSPVPENVLARMRRLFWFRQKKTKRTKESLDVDWFLGKACHPLALEEKRLVTPEEGGKTGKLPTGCSTCCILE